MTENKKTPEVLEIEVAELEEKLIAALEENELLKSAGQHDLSWYAKENESLRLKAEQAEAELVAAKNRDYQSRIDGEVIANDRKQENEKELVQYNQSEHTRFRIREHPNRLNIFGTPDGPVFDLGVDLNYFNGPVQIEAYVIVEMAQSIGMLTVEQATELKAELSEAKARNESAAILGTELTSGITTLVDKFYADLDSIVAPSNGTVEVPSEAESTDTGESNATDSQPNETDGQTDGDNSVKKSDGVSDSSGNADDKSESGNPTIDDILGKL